MTTETAAAVAAHQARREQRLPLDAEIEFIGDFDIVSARGIDVSRGGVCFEMSTPMVFDMRFTVEETTHERRAVLTWMRPLEGGGCRLGLRFIGDQREVDLGRSRADAI